MALNTQILIQYIFLAGSIIAAILAWIAKLRWSKEFKEAKEAQIVALENEKKVIEAKAEMYKDIVAQNHLKVLKENYQNLDKEFKELYEKYSLTEEARKELSDQLEIIMDTDMVLPTEEEIEEQEEAHDRFMEQQLSRFKTAFSEIATRYNIKKHLSASEYDSFISEVSHCFGYHS